MKFTWKTEWPLWALLAAMFVLAAITWPHAPDRIPVHWGLNGEVNRYGGKFEGLLLVPIIGLATYLLFLVVPRLDPGRANYAQFAGVYTLLRYSILVILALVDGIIHLWIRGVHVSIGTLIPLLVGALFVVLGSVLGKIRPNWFVGIRTPWTLSSKLAWTKTHRVGGWVFMATGLSLIVAGALNSRTVLIGAFALAFVGVLGTVVYSYIVWHGDPDRVPPAGTLPAD
jgi:immunity protein, SdpI family